ncbi:MAG: cytidine deaminase [Bacteroidales bacterium]|nr:cytidine deaminase [Bacteroidales bacterium]MBP5374460.1 cytidine deaminase [Bacteroidales bacterium]
MSNKQLVIDYDDYNSASEMSPEDQELVKEALEARHSSYSPYSHFQVGAALRLEDGTIVRGANQENNAYPSGLCAERTALFAAGVSHPGVPCDTIAVVAANNGVLLDKPATPCGSCRQVMAEYQRKSGKPLKVILVGQKRIHKFWKVDDLLPFIFDSI